MRCLLPLLLMVLVALQEVSSCRVGCDPSTTYGKANQTLHRLINNSPIDSLILRTPRYKFSNKYGIALLVISAEWEIKEREEIRKLWASSGESTMQKTGKSLVIFLVGRSSNLDKEASKHGDLLQVDIDETYRNLVYKIEAGFRWLNENVYSEFVAKVDSDTVVHIDRLYAILKRYESHYEYEWLLCHVWKGAPERNKHSHWYVSKSDYSHDTYPLYCNGPGYVMKRKVLEKIVSRMSEYQVIEVEDVFFTGILAQDLKIYLIGNTIVESIYSPFTYRDAHGPLMSILCTHDQFKGSKYKKDLAAAWKTLKNPDIK